MRSLLVALLMFWPMAAAVAQDVDPARQWAAWRGPNANGVAMHGEPPLVWSSKNNVQWKAPIPGRGSSTPIVWDDRIFIATAVDTGRAAKEEDLPKPDPTRVRKTQAPTTYHHFRLLCYDRDSGKVLWDRLAAERVPHEGHHPTHSYAAGSPTTDGKHVWVAFGSYGVYCYDMNGTQRWRRDLPKLYTRLGWGEATTPVLHQGSLVLNWDQESDSRLIVLDAATGATRYEVERDDPTSWNTPLIVEHEGVTQIILNGTKKARSYEFRSGKPLWECGGQTTNAIPSAVAADGLAILMSGYRGAFAAAIPLSSRGDVTGTDKVAWTYARGTPYVPSPVLVDGKLYFTQANDNLLTCLDAKTGKPYFERERLDAVNSFYASPVAAAGRIYLVDRAGTTVVLKQSTKVEVLATNPLDEEIDASPAVVGNQLFLRGLRHLYCLRNAAK